MRANFEFSFSSSFVRESTWMSGTERSRSAMKREACITLRFRFPEIRLDVSFGVCRVATVGPRLDCSQTVDLPPNPFSARVRFARVENVAATATSSRRRANMFFLFRVSQGTSPSSEVISSFYCSYRIRQAERRGKKSREAGRWAPEDRPGLTHGPRRPSRPRQGPAENELRGWLPVAFRAAPCDAVCLRPPLLSHARHCANIPFGVG